MAGRNGKNKEPEIESKISEITLVNNYGLKPFVEAFNLSPVNIVQQPLGNLFGFFKIKDASEDSAYIVNFLQSVLKKEYYINPKRSIEDSFDAALNKVNIALSEIAKNGNIGWIGSFESAVCVIKGDLFYFAVTGTARIIMLRDRYLSDISEGLSSGEGENHPLKTFTNVSSGPIKTGDKIIVTSDELFRIFSETEIKKNAERFPPEKFAQFLKTALVNELDSSETFVIDAAEKKPEPRPVRTEEAKKESPNFFSARPYEEKKKKKGVFEQETKEAGQEYTDEKTGHIYVRGEKEIPRSESRLEDIFSQMKERLANFLAFILERFSRTIAKAKRLIAAYREKKASASGEPAPSIQPAGPRTDFFRKIKSAFIPALGNIFSKARSLAPSPGRIKKAFAALSFRQKIVGVLTVLAIILVPLIVNKEKGFDNPASVPEEESARENNREKLAGEKNIRFDFAVSEAGSPEAGFRAAEFLDPYVIFMTEEKVVVRKEDGSEEEFPVPNGERIAAACKMTDLKLIFILTGSGRLMSFSPVSREFRENSLDIPAGARIKAMHSYLTYLYLADAQTGNIYRYPRAEGGFGSKADWLKQGLDMEAVSDMAIDENIYLSAPGRIEKLFKGGPVEAAFEAPAVAADYYRIATEPEYSNIYVLDRPNGRIIVYSKNGEILHQYYDQRFENASDFAANEKNNRIIVVLSDGSAAQFSL